ncbi:MAG: HD family phosphohydrolase [Humidesulfovibrio sp.]|nr:HD family phosphohydrolase [Humidesulfovibrio sp.]
MDPRIIELKRRAKDLAAGRPQNAFVLDCAEEIGHASTLFFEHPLMQRLQSDALGFLNEPCGLGVEHGKRVAIDAAALALAEPSGLDQEERRRLALLAEMAGLLHDTMRFEEDHAEKGADLSMRILRGYPLEPDERLWVAQAVALHETALPLAEAGPQSALLLSGALHDADRFRFGPDIFVSTLWELCDCDEWTFEEIARAFPEGPKRALTLANGFRTEQGRRYGPGLIGEGLSLATEYMRLFEQMLTKTALSNT